jgi:lipid-binding SYLF domain-containing protein
MNRYLAVVVIAVAALVSPVFAQKSPEGEVKRITDATTVMEEIMGAADKSIPRSVMEKAEGIAVFPSLVKGGVGLGGERGHGVLSVRDKKTAAGRRRRF